MVVLAVPLVGSSMAVKVFRVVMAIIVLGACTMKEVPVEVGMGTRRQVPELMAIPAPTTPIRQVQTSHMAAVAADLVPEVITTRQAVVAQVAVALEDTTAPGTAGRQILVVAVAHRLTPHFIGTVCTVGLAVVGSSLLGTQSDGSFR